MRILYLSDNSSDHNNRFLEKLISFGHEVYFLDLTQEGSAAWLPDGVSRLQLRQAVRRDADPSEYASIASELRFLLRDLRPDLLHAGPVQTCGYAAALSGFHPMVVMSWGSDLLVHAERNPEWRRATEMALRAADGFFCDCETVRATAQRYVAIPNERIVQFPWGIKRDSFSPRGPAVPRERLGLTPDVFTFISTRSWEPLYDIDVLLRAFNRAWQQNNRLRLLLLGTGTAANWVRSFVREHALGGMVVAPGMIAAEEMPRWFRAANAYVSCAKSDGTSISLLQAMASGLPVVVTDNSSNREWVTAGKNGWLAAVGSAEDFADKLLRAAKVEPNEREAISELNQNIVAERADWDRNFPGLVHLYEALVSRAVGMLV